MNYRTNADGLTLDQFIANRLLNRLGDADNFLDNADDDFLHIESARVVREAMRDYFHGGTA